MSILNQLNLFCKARHKLEPPELVSDRHAGKDRPEARAPAERPSPSPTVNHPRGPEGPSSDPRRGEDGEHAPRGRAEPPGGLGGPRTALQATGRWGPGRLAKRPAIGPWKGDKAKERRHREVMAYRDLAGAPVRKLQDIPSANAFAHLEESEFATVSRLRRKRGRVSRGDGIDYAEVATLGPWAKLRQKGLARLEWVTVRERSWALRDAARAIHPSERAAFCGYARVGAVGVTRRESGGYGLTGVAHCGSVHDCPVCAMAIKARRADDIQRGVELHRQHFGQASLALVTYTVRHSSEMPLADMTIGLQKAWNHFRTRMALEDKIRRRSDRDAGTFFEDVDYKGGVYGQEVTRGRNGWHLHRHEVAAFGRSLSELELKDFERRAALHWRDSVRLHMGPECAPDLVHGLRVDRLAVADYVSKLGLEVSDVGSKTSMGGATQWGLMQAAAEGDREAVLALGEYSCAMRGRKAVQFSDRLRRLWLELGLVLKEDDELVTEDNGSDLVLELPDIAWDELRATANTIQALKLESDEEMMGALLPMCPDGWATARQDWGEGSVVRSEGERKELARERVAIQRESGVKKAKPREKFLADYLAWTKAVDF
jgi:hypothetical protein